MKKLARLFIVFLIIPICFGFSACKNKNNNNNGSQVENPSGGGDNGSEGGGNNNTPSNVSRYDIVFDYNLPEEYAGLLTSLTVSDIEVGKSTTLATVPNRKLSPYFMGWSKDGETEIIEGTTYSSSVQGVVTLKGNWNKDGLKNYYYSDGLSFNIVDEKAVLTGYTGLETNIIVSRYYTVDGTDYKITKIGENAFKDKNLAKIKLNTDSIEIEKEAFKNCTISNIDFSKIKSVKDNAFDGSGLTKVTLYNCLDDIGVGAFKNCKSLTELDYSNLSIDVLTETFYGCEKLKTIKNFGNVASIQEYAFYGCEGLENIGFLGKNLTILEPHTFENCKGFVNVEIPENIERVNGNVFDGCENLASLTISRLYYNYTDGQNSLLEFIGDVSSSLKSITLAGETYITTIFTKYFVNLSNLESVTISNSVTCIEDYAFWKCSKLKNITLSENIDLENFTYLAFKDTKFINDLTEPFIYKNTIIYVPDNLPEIYAIPNGITKINDSAFMEKSGLKKLTIPSSVVKVGKSAFAGCSVLEEVVFEENTELTEISANMFDGCKKLKRMDLTSLKNLTKIGNEAFEDVNIENFVIPATVTTIGQNVFSSAKIKHFSISGNSEKFEVEDGILYAKNEDKLTLIAYPRYKEGEIYIVPKNVTAMESYAFYNARYLKYIYFSQENMDWIPLKNGGYKFYHVFSGTTNIVLLTENNNLVTNEKSESGIYRYLGYSGDGFTFNKSDNTITIKENYKPNYNYGYIKYYDSDKNKISLIYFSILKTYDSENNEVYQVSIKGSIETDFQS